MLSVEEETMNWYVEENFCCGSLEAWFIFSLYIGQAYFRCRNNWTESIYSYKRKLVWLLEQTLKVTEFYYIKQKVYGFSLKKI